MPDHTGWESHLKQGCHDSQLARKLTSFLEEISPNVMGGEKTPYVDLVSHLLILQAKAHTMS